MSNGISTWQLKIESNIKEVQSQIDTLEKSDHSLKLNFDTKTLEKTMKNLNAMLSSLGKGKGDVKSFDNLAKQLNGIVSDIKSVSTAIGKIDDSNLNNLLVSVNNIEKSLIGLTNSLQGVDAKFNNIGNSSGISSAEKQIKKIKNATDTATKSTEALANARKKIGNETSISTDVAKGLSASNDIDTTSFASFDDAWNIAQNINKELDKTKNKLDKLKPTVLTEGLQSAFQTLSENIGNLNKSYYTGGISNKSSYTAGVDNILNNYKKATSGVQEFANKFDKIMSDMQSRMSLIDGLDVSFKGDDSGWNKIVDDCKNVVSQMEDIEKLIKTLDNANGLDGMSDMVNNLRASWALSTKEVDDYVKSVRELEKKQSVAVADAESTIKKYQKVYESAASGNPDNKSQSYTNAIDSLRLNLSNLEAQKQKVSDSTIYSESDIKQLRNYEDEVKRCANAIGNFNKSQKGATATSITKEMSKLSDAIQKSAGFTDEARNKLAYYYKLLKSGSPDLDIEEIHSAWMDVYNAEITAGRGAITFFGMIKNSGIKKLAYDIGSMFSFYDIINAFKDGFSIVKDLDTALTEMRKVSDESINSLKEYQSTTFDVADAVGTTAKQIQNSTADYMRLGESMDEAAESARVANILMNVSEFDSIDDATSALISMGQAYSDLDKLTIVDKLNEVGNNYAISTDELATGLQDSAATLSLMGNSIDEAAALITTANSVIQDSSQVANGIRTIALRIVGTSEAEEQLELLGEEVDSFVAKTESKKQQIIKDYTAVASNNYQGVDILDDNGNYKNTYEILLEISKVYKEIQEEDKKYGTNRATALVEELAGEFCPKNIGIYF